MNNIWTILITAAATLLVSVIGGLVIEYIKRIKPKLLYKITDAVPIKIDEKIIGANVITLNNPSSKTIKEVSVKIKTTAKIVQNGGIKCTEGMEYNVLTTGDLLSILIPFLKPKDEVSITAITEGATYIPKTPEVSIRSPEVFKLVNENNIKEAKPLHTWLAPAIIMIIAVCVALIAFFADFSLSEPSMNLTVAATTAGLPNLAAQYAFHKDVYYYPSGALAYALAKEIPKLEEQNKYRMFLLKVIESTDYMSSSSKCALHFYLGKIEQLLNHKEAAQSCFAQAKKDNEKHYSKLFKLDQIETGQPDNEQKLPNKSNTADRQATPASR